MSQTKPSQTLEVRQLIPMVIRLTLVWGPVLVGVVHQILMWQFGIDEIYVFVNPPEYIVPFVTLGYQWWFVLLGISSFLAVMMYTGRFQNIPSRIAFPFYVYILYLLIFVKPV